MSELVDQLNSVVWGPVTILLLVGVGLYLTVRLRFIQYFSFLRSIRILTGREKSKADAEPGELSHFRALTVALSAAIGNGNIAGVATAITLGGPGAIFWMWVTAIVGMATVFASTTLSIHYRTYDEKRGFSGGPMHTIERGLGRRWKPMAKFFAFCAVLAAFGTGNMVEANSVADTLEYASRDILGYSDSASMVLSVKFAIGTVYAAVIWLIIVGGIQRIGHVVSRLVPLMFIVYVVSALIVLGLNVEAIPGAMGSIFEGAFSGTAASGGFAGASVMATIQFGVARGIFSNEAGLGTTPMAMATARTDSPVREGLVAMTTPFFDTLIVCTMTALVILTTGVWETGISGSELTTMAFSTVVPHLGKVAVTLSLVFFSISSVIGWSYYGDRGSLYLFGDRSIRGYKNLFCLLLPFGAVMKLELIWGLCDIANGLMAIPNLISIILLSPVVFRLTREYMSSEATSSKS